MLRFHTAMRAVFAAGLFVLAAAIIPLHASTNCTMEDDGDCCTADADCVAAVNTALCVVVPLNRIAAAKVAEYDPSASLPSCTQARVETLRGEARKIQVQCVHRACEFTGPHGD